MPSASEHRDALGSDATSPPSAFLRPGTITLPQRVGGCLKNAMSALEQGRIADAVEMTAAAAVEDIQQHQVTFLTGACEAGMLADVYAQCFARAGFDFDPCPTSLGSGPARVLYVAPTIAPGHGATQRLLHILRQHDRSRITPLLLVTEECTARTPPRQGLCWPDAPSSVIGSAELQQIRSLGIDPVFVPTAGDYLDGARHAIALARDMRPHVAIFVGTPACPIQAAMAQVGVAPRHLNQNVGVPLPVAGMHTIIYHNPRCAERDAGELRRRGIGLVSLPTSGVDAQACAASTPVARRELAIPESAPLLVSAGNKLPKRLVHSSFAHDLARFLQQNPDAWWLAIGPGDFAPVKRIFETFDVADRAAHVGPVADIRPLLKAGDIFLNEYPEGGCNTVMEAMGCGLPVVALDAGHRHAECIGAQLVGELYACAHIEAYWQMVSRLTKESVLRSHTGEALRQRAVSELSFKAVCARYEQCYLNDSSFVDGGVCCASTNATTVSPAPSVSSSSSVATG